MKFILALFLLSHSAFAIDVGDGSDGLCNSDGSGGATQITAARRYYQCTTLIINANLNVFRGDSATGFNGTPVVIKVQGLVRIDGAVVFDLSGENGPDGYAGGTVGGRAGAGGSTGGNSSASNGAAGNGAGGGSGGTAAPRTGFPSSFGGGGGGGSFNNPSATQPIAGDDNGNTVAAGSNGSANNFEINFDAIFTGGSGGAAGGGGIDSTATTRVGSPGGGGGGALRIIAGGDIDVNGTIESKGGNGGGLGTSISSGGGGGGSGGAVWLQSAGQLTVAGAIDVAGGTGGTNSLGFQGIGGDGSYGRIRLDDADGLIGGVVLTPTPYTTSFTPTPIINGTNSITRQYASNVSCASVALEDHDKPFNNFINLVLGMAVVAFAHFVASKRSKV